MFETAADQIDITGVEPEKVPTIREDGIIKSVKVSEPNQNGNQSVFIVIEYPVGSPTKQVMAGQLTYNEEKFNNKAGLTDGQIRWYNMNKARIKELRVAASTEDEPVKSFGDLKGRQVNFTAGPGFPDVTKYEFKSFAKSA